MPFCPKCRDEFQDWVKVCPDCGAELVEKLPKLPPKTRKLPRPTPNISSEPLSTVAVFAYPTEAHLHRAYLEANGIEGFVTDEHIITTNWLYLTAMGWVKLQVRRADFREARRLLRDIPQHIPEEAADEESSQERCPRCNSLDIRYEIFHLRAIFIFWFISFLILGLALASSLTLPFLKRKWRCRSCGYQWKQAQSKEKNSSTRSMYSAG